VTRESNKVGREEKKVGIGGIEAKRELKREGRA